MDAPDQAVAYANADFSDSNAAYVNELIRTYGDDLEHAVDLGCGPGDIIIRVARARPLARLTAVDASDAMLAIAKGAVGRAGFADRIRLVQGRIPGLPIPPRSFSAILSKDMLHHMHDPLGLWQEVQRLGRPGAAVHVMDLMRPASPELDKAISTAAAAMLHFTLDTSSDAARDRASSRLSFPSSRARSVSSSRASACS